MHNTFLNCCNEEMKVLTRTKTDETIEMRRDWSRKMSVYDNHRTSAAGLRIATLNSFPGDERPDIIQSADVN